MIQQIDCSHLSGTDCYCDAEGYQTLKNMIKDYPVYGVHFIDSGNYHYLTKLWTDRLKQPFTLVVFDHHPDMQPSLFEQLLSCGSWVKDVADCNPYCKRIIVAGASEKLIKSVPEQYKEKVHFFSDKELLNEKGWKDFASEHIEGPVYLSIDKDVLSPQFAVTNWDQGGMSIIELERLLHLIIDNHSVIGMDICGEFPVTDNLSENVIEGRIDNKVNTLLLALLGEG